MGGDSFEYVVHGGNVLEVELDVVLIDSNLIFARARLRFAERMA